MKLKRNLLIVCLLMGALGMLSLSSFTSYNACEAAGNNVSFVKEQTQLALDNQDFERSRYHAFKAINGIWNSKTSFTECGCKGLSINMELASKNLKEATRAISIEDQKVFLEIAMQNTLTGMTAIKSFKKGNKNNALTNNSAKTKATANSLKPAEEPYLNQIEAALTKFEKSLNKVVELDDCQNTYKFIRAMQDETHEKLGKKNLSNRKKYYLSRVAEITNDALHKINRDCVDINSLAGK